MSVALAVALLALLVALFTLAALVAMYARLRGLEAAGDVAVSGYPALVGRPAPVSVRPGPGDAAGLVAIVDGDCALCGAVLDALADVDAAGGVHVVALVPAAGPVPPPTIVVTPDVRASSHCCGQMKWMCVSMPPAVMI